MKALLLKSGKVIRSHDLVEILNVIKDELGLPVEEITQDADKLTSHYSISRYPDAVNSIPYTLYTKEDAEELVKRAERVIEWVRRNLL